MLIPSKHAGYVHGSLRVLPGGKGGPPPPDPRMFDILDKQVAQGDDLINFIKGSYEENKPRLAKQDALNEQVIGQNMRLAQSAEDRANDSYSFYKAEGRPVVSQALKDAKEWDSESNIADAQGRARTDTQLSFDSAQQQNNRMLARMGVNPNSMKFAALNNSLQMAKATATAGAVSQAGEQRRTQAVGMRQQAGNLASGMPAQSMGFSGQASGFGGAASGIGQAGIGQHMQAQGQVASGMQAGAGIYGSAAGQYNQLYGTQMQGYQAQQSANADMMGGLGQLAGTAATLYFMADGGKVKGPGSGTSDEVPAVNSDTGQRIQLSNGEYVIPADVVRKVGEDKFDTLLKKYHTPVRGNLGRAA